MKKLIGWANPGMGNYSSSLDFIEFFTKTSTSIYEIVGPLYKKGLSITDISEQTGLKRNSIWNALQSHKQELRTPNSVPFTRWRKGRGKMGARPPYGFCYFEGEVINDPNTTALFSSLPQSSSTLAKLKV